MGNKKGYWAGEKNPKYKHGQNHLKARGVWNAMHRRCYNKKSKLYAYYGARGLKVDSWWHNFDNFYKDMGDPPSGLSLERMDNNVGYSPENCVWGTKIAQMNNRRNSRKITYKGATKTISQWAHELGMARSTIMNRLDQQWPLDKVLSRTKHVPRPHQKLEF